MPSWPSQEEAEAEVEVAAEVPLEGRNFFFCNCILQLQCRQGAETYTCSNEGALKLWLHVRSARHTYCIWQLLDMNNMYMYVSVDCICGHCLKYT